MEDGDDISLLFWYLIHSNPFLEGEDDRILASCLNFSRYSIMHDHSHLFIWF